MAGDVQQVKMLDQRQDPKRGSYVVIHQQIFLFQALLEIPEASSPYDHVDPECSVGKSKPGLGWHRYMPKAPLFQASSEVPAASCSSPPSSIQNV